MFMWAAVTSSKVARSSSSEACRPPGRPATSTPPGRTPPPRSPPAGTRRRPGRRSTVRKPTRPSSTVSSPDLDGHRVQGLRAVGVRPPPLDPGDDHVTLAPRRSSARRRRTADRGGRLGFGGSGPARVPRRRRRPGSGTPETAAPAPVTTPASRTVTDTTPLSSSSQRATTRRSTTRTARGRLQAHGPPGPDRGRRDRPSRLPPEVGGPEPAQRLVVGHLRLPPRPGPAHGRAAA